MGREIFFISVSATDRGPADAEPHQKEKRATAPLLRLPAPHPAQWPKGDLSGWRLPAPMLEQTVVHLIRQHVDATTFSASLTHTPTMQELASVRRFLDGLCSGSNNDSASVAPLLRLIRRVDISPGSVSILLDRNAFAACLSMGPDRIREDALRIHAPFRLRRRGVETKLVLGNPTKSVDRTLLRNIRNALSWLDRIKAGKTYEQIATENAIPTDRVRKAIRYAFLAPDIVRAIVEGRQPVGLTSSYLCLLFIQTRAPNLISFQSTGTQCLHDLVICSRSHPCFQDSSRAPGRLALLRPSCAKTRSW